MKEIIRKYVLQNALKFGKAEPGRIIGKVLGERPGLREKAGEVQAEIKKAVSEINKMSKEQIEKELKKLAPEMLEEKKPEKKELPELRDVGQKVAMRFAPSPSGPLHLGHSYVLGLNSEYCRQYKGRLVIRIEDTNPANIDPSAYEKIPEDAQWLTKNNVAEVIIQSARLENYYNHAVTMLEKGHTYICTCPADEFREYAQKKEDCPCRKNDAGLNLKLWKKMFDPKEMKEGEAVMRLKTDMKHKNPAMRDFPLMRINDEEHPKTGKKYRVWPLMNFSVACDDYDTGMTHILRGKDHADNAKRQEFIQHAMGWPVPQTLFVGRINFIGLNLSCSETMQMIKDGKYGAWDDIRLPFLGALKRRGYQPEAFIKYALSVGVSLTDKRVEKEEFFKALNAFNKDFIDPVSYRYFFIWEPVEIKIEGAPEMDIDLDLHPHNKKGGRAFETKDRFLITKEDFDSLEDEKMYRLMDCLNFVRKKDRFIFDSVEYERFKEKGEKIMHWLPVSKSLIPVEVLMDDADASVVKGVGEENMRGLEPGQIVQLERFGFCRLDDYDLSGKKQRLLFWFGHK